MRRLAPGVLAALVALAAVLRLGVIVNRPIDPDESQHLHVAWQLGQGAVPYRDFWEHHLPLFHYLAAPVTRWLRDDPAVYFAARGAMALAAAGAVVLTAWLAAGVAPAAAAWSVLVLVFLPQFAETSTETRPDVPALLAHLGGLAAVVQWRRGRGAPWLWGAGLAEGLGLALAVKALYGLVGLGLVVALGGRPSCPAASRAGALARFVVGGAVVPAGLLAWLLWQGGMPALHGLGADVVLGSLAFVDYAKTWPAFGSEVGAFLAAGVGLGLALRGAGRRILEHPVHGTLLVPSALTAAVQAWPWTPAVYQQAWLPLLPVVSVYGGLALLRLDTWGQERPSRLRRAAVIGGIAVVLGVPAAQSALFALREQNAAQLVLMADMLRRACPGEPVLDGTALYVFRPAAYRFGALVTGVREWVARGAIAEETIEGDMRAAHARIAYPDRRIRGMIGPIATFLDRHYVPGGNGLLVAGARIPAFPDTGGGRAYVDLLVPGPYLLTPAPGLEVRIDGRPAGPGWVTLDPGRHEVTWIGHGGPIGLVAATCPERRALGLALPLTAPGGGG